jgi:hypothetical protein
MEYQRRPVDISSTPPPEQKRYRSKRGPAQRTRLSSWWSVAPGRTPRGPYCCGGTIANSSTRRRSAGSCWRAVHALPYARRPKARAEMTHDGVLLASPLLGELEGGHGVVEIVRELQRVNLHACHRVTIALGLPAPRLTLLPLLTLAPARAVCLSAPTPCRYLACPAQLSPAHATARHQALRVFTLLTIPASRRSSRSSRPSCVMFMYTRRRPTFTDAGA